MPVLKPSVTVVIPWRPSPGREQHLALVRARIATALGDTETILADNLADPFSRAGSKNAGAAAATGDVLVFCDADTLIDVTALREAVTSAGDGRLHYPFTNYRSMTAAESAEVLAGRDPATTRGHGDVPTSVGGCVVVARDAFIAYDERFIGWGHEDAAFAMAAVTMTGPFIRHEGIVHHLFHPDGRAIGSPQWQANHALCLRYEAACGDREAMQALIEERSCVSA